MTTALLQKGFRPFFLLAALYGAAAAPLWLLVQPGNLRPAGPLQGAVWHAHEMIFGYTLAVIAGFLLTATENWTGRTTARSWSLLTLVAAWVGARVLLWVGGPLGPIVDIAFVLLLVVALGRAILGTKNWRNAPLLGVVLVLALVNTAVYAAVQTGRVDLAMLALRSSVYLVAVIL